MKKTALVVLALAATIAFSACAKKAPPAPPPPPPPVAPEVPPPAPPPPPRPEVAPVVDEYARIKAMSAEEIEKSGLRIRSIAAAHTQGDPLVPKSATDYIFIIDMGGLRIVHFGDIGQPALTPEQAKAVGRVDVAVTQFDNAQFSDIDVKNKKGFRLMEQVKPRLIVQTHSSLAAVNYAATLWPVLYSKRPGVTLSAAGLPKKTSLLLLGEEGAYYVESGVHARKVDW